MSGKLDAHAALTFVIIGGSIAGLATAFALQHAGHRCHILEASDAPRGGRGPCRSPPNMTKILDRWGLSEELRSSGITKTAIVFRDGDSGEKIGIQELTPSVMKQLETTFLAFQHSDLFTLLTKAAINAGASIRSNARVTSIDLKGLMPAVTLESGERVQGDIIIGAGGFSSLARKVVLEGAPSGIPDPRIAYNFTIPLDAVRQDPELHHLAQSSDWQIFMGNHCCLQGYAEPSSSQYVMLLKAPTLDQAPAGEVWDDVRPFDMLTINIDGLGSHAQKLMGMAKEALVTQHVAHQPFEQWVDQESRIVLVGDAAHPLVPSGSQSVAMAIEDAATLGELFRRMTSKSQVAALLSAFEDIRQPRTAEIQASERGKTDFVSLPRGSAARTARDEGFKAAMAAAVEELEDAEEEVVATNLGDYVAQWAHDAHDAVEDWWTKYGGILDGQDDANGKLGASSAEGTMRDRALSVTEVKMKVERFVSTAVAV